MIVPDSRFAEHGSAVPDHPSSIARVEAVPALAVFGFDGTLLRGDTLLFLHRLLRGSAGRVIDRLRLLPAALMRVCGLCSSSCFEERVLRRILSGSAGQPPGALFREQLAVRLIACLNPAALACLEEHRRQGDRLIIVSASPRQLLQPVADHLGCELLATETTDLTRHSAATPLRFVSAPCRGTETIRRLEMALERSIDSVVLHAYGRSQADRQLLRAADHPHWRSFSAEAVPYPSSPSGSLLLRLLALALLLMLGWGLLHLPAAQQRHLLAALGRLPAWLPALYGVLAVSFLLRYCRWRLLLGAHGIGGWCLADAIGWFRGFALTATPAKLGELSRVHALHRDLGYPRLPLLQVFLIERLLDAGAVLLLLAWLTPATIGPLRAQLKPSLSSMPGLPLAAAAAALLAAGSLLLLGRRASLRPGLSSRLRHGILRLRQAGGQHLVPALIPAAAVSLLIWSTEPLLLWLLIRALSPQWLSVQAALATYLISGMAGMASSLPAGIGVNEGATVLLLGQQGVPIGPALTIAIVRRLLAPWSIVALAAAMAWIRLPQKSA